MGESILVACAATCNFHTIDSPHRLCEPIMPQSECRSIPQSVECMAQLSHQRGRRLIEGKKSNHYPCTTLGALNGMVYVYVNNSNS